MPSIPGVPHQVAVRALQKAGFDVIHQGKQIVMSNGQSNSNDPSSEPVNALTMGGIVKDAGLSVEEFNRLR